MDYLLKELIGRLGDLVTHDAPLSVGAQSQVETLSADIQNLLASVWEDPEDNRQYWRNIDQASLEQALTSLGQIGRFGVEPLENTFDRINEQLEPLVDSYKEIKKAFDYAEGYRITKELRYTNTHWNTENDQIEINTLGQRGFDKSFHFTEEKFGTQRPFSFSPPNPDDDKSISLSDVVLNEEAEQAWKLREGMRDLSVGDIDAQATEHYARLQQTLDDNFLMFFHTKQVLTDQEKEDRKTSLYDKDAVHYEDLEGKEYLYFNMDRLFYGHILRWEYNPEGVGESTLLTWQEIREMNTRLDIDVRLKRLATRKGSQFDSPNNDFHPKNRVAHILENRLIRTDHEKITPGAIETVNRLTQESQELPVRVTPKYFDGINKKALIFAVASAALLLVTLTMALLYPEVFNGDSFAHLGIPTLAHMAVFANTEESETTTPSVSPRVNSVETGVP